MSAATSSAGSSTLARSKGAILVVSALVCALGVYSVWKAVNEDEETSAPGPGLRRSNAVHRRRRHTETETITDGRPDESADTPLASIETSTDAHFDPSVRALTDGETVVDDGPFQEDYNWTHVPPTYERNGQNIVQLLFRVSEDATRRNAYVHRGCECNACGSVPIRGIRYHCANCADYDLCEGCEAQGLHTKTHIFYKIRVPAPSFGPMLSMPVAYTGDPENTMRVLSKEITTKLSRETGFERPELDAYWEQWTFMANTDWRDDPDDINLAMDRTTFEHCLVPSGGYRQLAPSLIFDRMFAFYDTNNDNLIGFSEFLQGIAYRKKKDKWTKIFAGYDIDGDGFVERKDFLRMFRSYYVLYRQMHRDMLGGMQEQSMITPDAHRLVNGRQPLSSAFSHEGRFPRAPDIKAGEGKSIQPNGDLDINDGKGTLNESGTDTGNREDIFRGIPMDQSMWNRIDQSTGYWETIMNPPTSISNLRDLEQLNRVRGAVQEILHGTGSNPDSALAPQDETEDEEESSDDSDSEAISISDPDNDDTWLPDFVTVTDEDAEAVDGPGTRLVDLRRTSRRAAIVHAVSRERAQRDIHERWKRRQFYTDEEEGGTPPAGWKDDDDILAQNHVAGESSKSNSRPSFHSRSSSKVRFAEDMDDFDTRSNPSTSSRSVPERWGGFEIPDAEKDAGKEILFQVTQQAFNELLDPLFKDKEDVAIDAATHKRDIERYRPLYSEPDFAKWAEEKASKEALSKSSLNRSAQPFTTTARGTPIFTEVEIEEVRERPLEDLLAISGYSVDETLNSSNVIGVARNDGLPRAASEAPRAETGDGSPNNMQETLHSSTSSSDLAADSTQFSRPHASPAPESEVQHDPTMPQFRPNSDATLSAQGLNVSSKVGVTDAEPQNFVHSEPTKVLPSSSTIEEDSSPAQEHLYMLWKADRAAKEAEVRGGWGRLSFEEFEGRVKKFVKEGRGNQMDYLGSWIEFCIP